MFDDGSRPARSQGSGAGDRMARPPADPRPGTGRGVAPGDGPAGGRRRSSLPPRCPTTTCHPRARAGPVGGGAGTGPPILSRQELRQQAAAEGPGSGRGRWYVLAGVVVVVVAVVAAVVLTRGTERHRGQGGRAAATTTAAPAPVATCPLTGTPAPGGVVPARPALGVKIGNYPGDRPSAGLNQADIVFEEPVEGAITRLLAVFQCQSARPGRRPPVGPGARRRHPLPAVQPAVRPRRRDRLRSSPSSPSSPLTDENLSTGAAVGHHPASRAGWRPYSTFVNTASLWALDPSDTTPPAPIFQYSAAPPAGLGGRLGSQRPHPLLVVVRRDLDSGTPPRGKYLRSYSGVPDIAARRIPDRGHQRGDHDRADRHRSVGREQRGRPRGRGHRHRHRTPGGDAQRRRPSPAPGAGPASPNRPP